MRTFHFYLHRTIDFGEEIYYIKTNRQHSHYNERYHYHNSNQMQFVSSFCEKLNLSGKQISNQFLPSTLMEIFFRHENMNFGFPIKT